MMGCQGLIEGKKGDVMRKIGKTNDVTYEIIFEI